MDLKYWSVQVICFLFDNRYTIDRREFLIGSEQLVFYFFEKFETILFSFETGFYLFENNGKKNVHLQLTFMSSTSKTRVELGGMQPGTPLAPYPMSWKWKMNKNQIKRSRHISSLKIIEVIIYWKPLYVNLNLWWKELVKPNYHPLTNLSLFIAAVENILELFDSTFSDM